MILPRSEVPSRDHEATELFIGNADEEDLEAELHELIYVTTSMAMSPVDSNV
jgi:hypothetical protein